MALCPLLQREPGVHDPGTTWLTMRVLALFLVATTVVLLASGVAMGIVHGNTLTIARRLHGPASVVWIVLVGVHVLVYLKRALMSSSEDVAPSSRASVRRCRAPVPTCSRVRSSSAS